MLVAVDIFKIVCSKFIICPWNNSFQPNCTKIGVCVDLLLVMENKAKFTIFVLLIFMQWIYGKCYFAIRINVNFILLKKICCGTERFFNCSEILFYFK